MGRRCLEIGVPGFYNIIRLLPSASPSWCMVSILRSPRGPRDFWSSSQHISIEGQKEEERYERTEIPIHIVPHVTIGKVCLESAVELPKILCQEEQDAYRRIHSLTHLDSVTKIHNGSVFTKNLCSQMSVVSRPLLQ